MEEKNNENMNLWNSVSKVPPTYLKAIQAGRLKGKSDINPQWRIKAMTEKFGVCGVGWKYTIEKLWTIPGVENEVFAFSEVKLYIKSSSGEWSEAVPGIGGSMLQETQISGVHHNDEAFKMATTDALSVAMKAIGIGADIYLGNWDGSKYREEREEKEEKKLNAPEIKYISDKQTSTLLDWMSATNTKEISFCNYYKIKKMQDLPESKYNEAIEFFKKKSEEIIKEKKK